MRVVTMQHTWVKHVITKVEVLEGLDGQPVVMVDPEQERLAQEDAAYGCNVCGLSMANNFDTPCTGLTDEG